MQLRKLLLPGLLSVTLLSGCSLFNSEEDVVKMSPLPTVENQFTPVHVLEHLGWRWYRRILL
ncbi:outer membrane protein YfgL [Klebsiella pneumoniae]|nr:outer membrane protein YfgL [Klebsiella pneumoniae]